MKNLDTSSTVETPVFETILLRKSRRAYSHQPVEAEKINSLFEAARWAPSSVNEQPWTYLYATRNEEALWKKIFDTLSDGNKIWAKDAPLLIVSMARKNFTRTGNVNTSAKYDLGGANAFLSLHATELGLNVHQMGGFDPVALRKNLNVPEAYELGVILAVGYPGDADLLPENLKQRELAPRVRVQQTEFVMNKSF